MTESDPPLGPWVQNFFCQRLQAQQRVSPARGWPSRSNASTVAWCSRCPYRKSKPSWRPPTRLAPEPDAIGGSSVCSITPAPVFPKLCNSGAKTLSGDPPAGFASTAKDAENAPSRGCRRWRGNSNARWPKAPRPPGAWLFENRSGQPLTRSGVEKRLNQALRRAARRCPTLKTRTVSPHVFRPTTALRLLQADLDITVIARLLGHASPTTTHHYIELDLQMKERCLRKLQSPKARATRFKPEDGLRKFLEAL